MRHFTWQLPTLLPTLFIVHSEATLHLSEQTSVVSDINPDIRPTRIQLIQKPDIRLDIFIQPKKDRISGSRISGYKAFWKLVIRYFYKQDIRNF